MTGTLTHDLETGQKGTTMHPKYWKFPGGRRFMDTATGDEGGKSAGGGGGSAEPTEAEKAAPAEAAAAAAAAGGKKPSDEEAKLLKEVMQKKEALKATEATLAAAQARLAEFDGVDPAAIRKLLKDQKDAEEAQLAAKGEFETLRTRMAEEHTRVTASLQEQITALTAQLASKDKVVDELSIGTQFSQSKFITEESTMAPAKARKLFGDHFDVVEGKVVAFDKPRGEANRAPLVDQLGNNVAFEDAMRKIVEADPDKDSLLRSKVKSGAGSESKSVAKVPAQKEAATDSLSKIGAGLKLSNLLAEKPL
jgi:hypothetical protein